MSRLTQKLSPLIAGLQKKLPEQKVGLVPGDAFFVRTVDLPAGLSEGESEAFIQLNLEGNSPFPMEQLAWGYLHSGDSPHAFAYATPKSRLKRLEFAHLESYFQLFPGFLTLYGAPVERPTIRFLSQNGILSALFLQPGQSVPARILSKRISGDLLTDDLLAQARETMLCGLEKNGYGCEDGLWLGVGTEIHPNGSVSFDHRWVGPGTIANKKNTLKFDERTLWAVDLRDDAYAGRQANIRRRSKIIWKSMTAGAWCTALLLFLQVGNFALRGLNLVLEHRIGNVEPLAVRVENKLTLASRLTQSVEEDIKPFVLMESINPLRPDAVFFEKVRTRAFNEMEIAGRSSEGVTPVNAFADSIGQLPFVASVENNSQTRNNQTSFDFVIRFSEIPPEPEGGFVLPVSETVESTESEGGEE
jgi:hypothetical protein